MYKQYSYLKDLILNHKSGFLFKPQSDQSTRHILAVNQHFIKKMKKNSVQKRGEPGIISR